MKLIKFINNTFLHDNDQVGTFSDYVIFYGFLSISLLSGLILIIMILGGV